MLFISPLTCSEAVWRWFNIFHHTLFYGKSFSVDQLTSGHKIFCRVSSKFSSAISTVTLRSLHVFAFHQRHFTHFRCCRSKFAFKSETESPCERVELFKELLSLLLRWAGRHEIFSRPLVVVLETCWVQQEENQENEIVWCEKTVCIYNLCFKNKLPQFDGREFANLKLHTFSRVSAVCFLSTLNCCRCDWNFIYFYNSLSWCVFSFVILCSPPRSMLFQV